MPGSNRWWTRAAKPRRDQIVTVSAEVDIAASPREVWNLIRPSENAALIEPSTIRAFHVPGTPYGVGELQGSIGKQNGREYVSVIEVLEEVDARYALIRSLGTDDDANRMAYRVNDSRSGARMELRVTFTIPATMWANASLVEDDVRRHHEELARRIKSILESDQPYHGKSGSPSA